MSTTNKLNTEPHCTFVLAAVVSDKKCIIFFSVHGTRIHHDSLQLTYVVNRSFAAVQRHRHYAFFQIPVIMLSLTFLLMVSGRYLGFPLQTPFYIHLISCHLLSKVTRILYFHFTPHLFEEPWEESIHKIERVQTINRVVSSSKNRYNKSLYISK